MTYVAEFGDINRDRARSGRRSALLLGEKQDLVGNLGKQRPVDFRRRISSSRIDLGFCIAAGQFQKPFSGHGKIARLLGPDLIDLEKRHHVPRARGRFFSFTAKRLAGIMTLETRSRRIGRGSSQP